ncbi:putative acyl- dehydrogenase [Diplodia seriata]|uniref:Putative acyl-dehydrogenase n=1 Tax=Diplodia seriata TaxID=420778 RepID=A0A0G2ELV8_9PEZI|nr:putative acyl- dehydrogenase [Diplodia seriata]
MAPFSSTTLTTALPADLTDYLARLDDFIARTIEPLQARDDNNRFFDHRREHARTDWDGHGLPRPEWEALLAQATRLADDAGFWRLSLPEQYGGSGGSNLWMAVVREHLAARGLGLANDLQNEHSVVGNFPDVVMVHRFGTDAQRAELIGGRLRGEVRVTFGLTEPGHGSDATWMETRAVRERRSGREGWRLDGRKMWQTGMHRATHCFVFARTSGRDGAAKGITCFVVPRETPGIKVESYEWTLNMPTDHATVSFTNVWVPHSAILGAADAGLAVAQAFVHENRLRQAASSLGAASYCITQSITHANARAPFGRPLSANQAVQFPLVELATQAEMLRLLIRATAAEMDELLATTTGATTTGATTTRGEEGDDDDDAVETKLSHKVAMCNYFANRLCTDAADRAIQVHGGLGYSRHLPFEHIWRHHRRYRITEGSEEIQMRKVAMHLFGFGSSGKKEIKL